MKSLRGSAALFRSSMAPLAMSILVLGLVAVKPPPAPAQGEKPPETTCVRMEVYVRGDSERSKKAEDFLAKLEERRPGVRVDVFDVLKDQEARARLQSLAATFGRKAALPTVYACNQMVVGFQDAATTGAQIEGLLTMEVFYREGCSRCAAAMPYLEGVRQRYPGLKVVFHEVRSDLNAQIRMNQLCESYRISPGLPTIHFGGRLSVGWSGLEITGAQLEDQVRHACTACREPREAAPAPGTPAAPPASAPAPARERAREPTKGRSSFLRLVPPRFALPVLLGFQPGPAQLPRPAPDGAGGAVAPPEAAEIPGDADIPEEAEPGTSEVLRPLEQPDHDQVEVPWLGTLSVRQLGLPAFTFLIGLVDGFNPCAMWVLVFLLSVLAGLNDRRKMLAIAGTFVLISGLAYFVFMAAWLNVFLLLGYLRWVEIVLGLMAVLIGAVHIKDFFAFKKGLTLSIPESAKPGIYARVRQVVSARSLFPALAGAVVLAVLVNTVELLCTAGLPALYTSILTAQGFPLWMNYLYLLLYIAAYMLDDALLLTVVVITLSRRRLQEREGRWLKLVSGLVILGLGLVMLFQPAWLR